MDAVRPDQRRGGRGHQPHHRFPVGGSDPCGAADFRDRGRFRRRPRAAIDLHDRCDPGRGQLFRALRPPFRQPDRRRHAARAECALDQWRAALRTAHPLDRFALAGPSPQRAPHAAARGLQSKGRMIKLPALSNQFRPAMSQDNIFREIDEELRSDRMRALWRRFGPFVIGAAVAIVVLVAANEGWSWYTKSRSASASEELYAALEAADR